jgi:hypothetical protein
VVRKGKAGDEEDTHRPLWEERGGELESGISPTRTLCMLILKVWAACRQGFLKAQTEVCREVCEKKQPYSDKALSRK